MSKRKIKYPSGNEPDIKRCYEDEEPDFICGAPNYDKFEGWTAEEVLAWLNID